MHFALGLCEEALAVEIDVTMLLGLTKEYVASSKIDELKTKFNKRFEEVYKRVPGSTFSFFYNDTNRPGYDFSESPRNDNDVLENPCFAEILLNINGIRLRRLSSLGELFDCVENEGWPGTKEPKVILKVSMKTLLQHRSRERQIIAQQQQEPKCEAGDKHPHLSPQHTPSASSSPQTQSQNPYDGREGEEDQDSIQRYAKHAVSQKQLSQSPQQQNTQSPKHTALGPVLVKTREESIKLGKTWGAERTMKMIGSTIAEETLLELQHKERITLEVIQAVDQLMNCTDSRVSKIHLKLVEPREGRSLFCLELKKNDELVVKTFSCLQHDNKRK